MAARSRSVSRGDGRKAVYAGSFDPVTNGHLYMIREGAKLFDEIVVAVGRNPGKTYAFSDEERVTMLSSATKGIANASVERFDGSYLVDFARTAGARYVLRGLRTESDYAFERTLRNVNGDICPEITAVFLMPPRELAEVSSSFVMGLVGPAGWEEVVARYVPEDVLRVLQGRFGGGK